MEMIWTAVYRKVPEGYIGFVEELPGANTQGATLEETRENLKEALELVIEANREFRGIVKSTTFSRAKSAAIYRFLNRGIRSK